MMSDCKECISDDAENKCTTEVNAKYMNSLEEPYTYQTQVAGKAVSFVYLEKHGTYAYSQCILI